MIKFSSIDLSQSLRWDDIRCNDRRRPLCKRACSNIPPEEEPPPDEQPPNDEDNDDNDNDDNEEEAFLESVLGFGVLGGAGFLTLCVISLLVFFFVNKSKSKSPKQKADVNDFEAKLASQSEPRPESTVSAGFPMPDSPRPNKSYIEEAAGKDEQYRSIFSPSNDYIRKQMEHKKKLDSLDI